MANDSSMWVVVPNWNGADVLGACLRSLEEQTQPVTIVVVDNGSTDDSVGIVEREFPQVEVLKLKENLGFAGGVNAGLRHALGNHAKFIALFNNDAVADKRFLEQLVSSLQARPKTGIVTGKLMRDDKIHIDSTGEFYSIWGMPFPRGRNQRDQGQYDETGPVFAASGGASLYRAEMLDRVGLFDERYFAYMEDIDISFRAQLAGWSVWYNPLALAYHEVGHTSSKLGNFTRYHFIKNFHMTYFKNMPSWLYWKYLPLFIVLSAALFVSATLKGAGWAYLRGTGRAFLNLPYLIKERRRIQAARVVLAKDIDRLLYKRRPPKIPEL